jgi:hypothetical protein
MVKGDGSDGEDMKARIRSAGTIPRPRSVSCDPDASGLTMVYLAGKLLP